MAEEKSINAQTAARVKDDLYEIGGLLMSMRDAIETKVPGGKFDGIDKLVTLAIERAGSLTDGCISAFGGSGICGDFEAWNRHQASSTEAAGPSV
jgi:hypothetical protein